MIPVHPQLTLPLLFAVNHQLSCSVTFPHASGLRNIHLPHRLIRNFEGLAIIPNSTTQPVRVASSSVIMSFDVSHGSDFCWNARMISSNETKCDLFLMDNVTLKPIMYVKLRVEYPTRSSGYTVAINARLFDMYTLIGVWFMLASLKYLTPIHSLWVKRNMAHGADLRKDMEIHRKYMKMALTAERGR
jgi:hypothetical protein